MSWIKCSERLPENNGLYLIAYESGSVSTDEWGMWDGKRLEFYTDGDEDGKVTHWQPLPEPPKDGE